MLKGLSQLQGQYETQEGKIKDPVVEKSSGTCHVFSMFLTVSVFSVDIEAF